MPQLAGDEHEQDLLSRYWLEYGLAHHHYGNDTLAKSYFEVSQQHTGLDWTMTGALGRRTKFQTFDVTQLVLHASSVSVSDATPKNAPKTLELQDDVLLENVKFTDPQGQQQQNLSVIDQCLLLAFW